MQIATINLVRTIMAGAVTLQVGFFNAKAQTSSNSDQRQVIRSFTVHIPEAALRELQQRILATRWPEKETVADHTQGIQLTKVKEIINYWGKTYDWRKAEAKLNAFPQFITTIDGLDIHFIHVRSKHKNALPIIITHGWPGSVFEQIKLIGPLTDPTAYGGKVEDAFDVVIPSLPGVGFSGKPQTIGWGPERIALCWGKLMNRLGYSRYVAQGGDWGSPISSAMARLQVAGLAGIHLNLPATVPSDIAKALMNGESAPAGLSQKEKIAFASLASFYQKYRAYAAVMGTRPQTIGYSLTDSPVGLATWMYDYNNAEPERSLIREEFLDNITLYWLTNTATTAARIYWETRGQSVLLADAQKTFDISLPVAITVFPQEVYQAPESWAKRAYKKLIYYNEVMEGGHFAAWEVPRLLATEIRSAFQTLRPAH